MSVPDPRKVYGYGPQRHPEPLRCSCPDRLVDHVTGRIVHPYADCPFYGIATYEREGEQ